MIKPGSRVTVRLFNSLDGKYAKETTTGTVVEVLTPFDRGNSRWAHQLPKWLSWAKEEKAYVVHRDDGQNAPKEVICHRKEISLLKKGLPHE